MSAPTLIAAPDHGDTLTADVNDALGKLAALGSPGQIADHLQRELIRGVCGDPGQCAVAAYLDHAVPRVRNAVLYVDRRMWSTYDPRADRLDRRGPMPDVVAQFISRFDAGGYPGLRSADSPAHAPFPF